MKKSPTDNAYPFVTKTEVKYHVEHDTEFALKCALILEQRTRDRESGRAASGGWMSSHRSMAGKLVAKLVAGELSASDRETLVKAVASYSRFLAAHAREQALRERPELAPLAAKFGVALPATWQRGGPTVEQSGQDGSPPPGACANAEPVDADAKQLDATQRAEAEDRSCAADGNLGEDPGDGVGTGVAAPPSEDTADSFEEGIAIEVRQHPGIRIEELARLLGKATAEVSPSLQGLLARKILRRRGEGRWAQYFVR